MIDNIIETVDTLDSLSVFNPIIKSPEEIGDYANKYRHKIKPDIIGLANTTSQSVIYFGHIKNPLTEEVPLKNTDVWRNKNWTKQNLYPSQLNDYVLLTQPSSGSLDEPKRKAHISPKALAAIELLKSWREETNEEDEKEQQESLKLLEKSLNEDRLSNRKLF